MPAHAEFNPFLPLDGTLVPYGEMYWLECVAGYQGLSGFAECTDGGDDIGSWALNPVSLNCSGKHYNPFFHTTLKRQKSLKG